MRGGLPTAAMTGLTAAGCRGRPGAVRGRARRMKRRRMKRRGMKRRGMKRRGMKRAGEETRDVVGDARVRRTAIARARVGEEDMIRPSSEPVRASCVDHRNHIGLIGVPKPGHRVECEVECGDPRVVVGAVERQELCEVEARLPFDIVVVLGERFGGIDQRLENGGAHILRLRVGSAALGDEALDEIPRSAAHGQHLVWPIREPGASAQIESDVPFIRSLRHRPPLPCSGRQAP